MKRFIELEVYTLFPTNLTLKKEAVQVSHIASISQEIDHTRIAMVCAPYLHTPHPMDYITDCIGECYDVDYIVLDKINPSKPEAQ